MLDNSFQVRYDKLPIATYAISEPPLSAPTPFMLPHHHSEFEVIAVVCGRCQVTIDQSLYTVAGGDILFIPPYSLHSGRILPGESFSHFCFCFDLSILKEDEFARRITSGYLEPCRVVRGSEGGSGALRHAAQCVYHQCEEREKGWDLAVRGQLLYLMGLLRQQGRLCSTACKETRSDFSTRVLDILSRTYSAPLTSREVAARMSYSQSYFCRLFRESFSLSFQEYLCQYRLCKARLLLAQNKLSVGEAALQVGFNSPSYFTKRFRALYGCTPKQFQATHAASSGVYEYYLGNSVRLSEK